MRTTSVISILLLAAFFAVGCERDSAAENAAEAIDEAIDEVEDTAENVRDGVEDARRELENPQ